MHKRWALVGVLGDCPGQRDRQALRVLLALPERQALAGEGISTSGITSHRRISTTATTKGITWSQGEPEYSQQCDLVKLWRDSLLDMEHHPIKLP